MLYEENAGRNIWRGLSPARLSVLIKPELAGVADLSYPAPPRRLSKASAFNLLSPIPPPPTFRVQQSIFLLRPSGYREIGYRCSRDQISRQREDDRWSGKSDEGDRYMDEIEIPDGSIFRREEE